MHPRAAEGRARQAQRDMDHAGLVDEQRAAFEERIRRRALIRHAEARMRERPLMRRFEERRRVGENLWALLEEIEHGPRGISKARVLQAAIGADPIDSTKHLARYAIRPSDDPAVAQRRGRYLLKTAVKFVRIARVAADLGGLDPDSAALRILDGTVYTQDAPESAVDEHMDHRADTLAAMLADIAGRLCRKHRVGAGIRRMEEAGWALRAPGDLNSPMQVDPALIGSALVPATVNAGGVPSAPPFPRYLPWAQIERYPHLHLGYVSGEKSQLRTFGRVVGKFQFEDAEGDRFETELGIFDVCCWPVFRIDLILVPKSRGSESTLMWALSFVTWVKPTERLTWTGPSGAEYWIGQDETLGEIATFMAPREATGLIDPDHGIALNASRLAWADGSWSGSLMLLTDEEGRVTSDFRPSLAERQVSLDVIKVCHAPMLRDVAFLSPWPNLMLCDQPVLHRHFARDARIAHLWTDERPTGTPYADHPLAEDPVPAAPALDPVEAPEGSLSARLERWLQGTLANRETFEEDLEAAVVAFMARLEATTGAARERLAAAVYGKR
jgi:hypothetical protein